MNRLSVRLLASHVLVAVVATLTGYAVVRLAAPAIFDESLRHGGGLGGGFGPGVGQGQGRALRQAFADAVDQAILWGALAGVLTAALAAQLSAGRLLGPLHRIGSATRRIAAGHYEEPVARPRERELAALADDVNRLGATLHRTERTRVRLLGEVAHEMRTPLTVIDGYLDGMADGVLPVTPANLDLLRAESARLRRLAQDLSTLSRGAEHRLEVDRRIQPLAPVVAEAANRLAPLAAQADVDLRIEEPDRPVPADIDPERITQVVTNLVRNAIQATPPGGLVTVAVVEGEAGPGVLVSDTGRGLAQGDLERVFERFYRVEGPDGPPGRGGAGIGLSIARDIASAHGGRLTAASAGSGAGATLTLSLPRPSATALG